MTPLHYFSITKTLIYLTVALVLTPVFMVFFPVTVLPLNETINFVDLIDERMLSIVFGTIGLLTYAIWQLRPFLESLSTSQFVILVALLSIPFIGLYPGDSDDFFTNFWYAERVLYLNEIPYQQEHFQENYRNYQTDLPAISPAPFLPYGPLWLGLQTTIYGLLGAFPIIIKVLIFKTTQFSVWLISVYLLDKLTAIVQNSRNGTMRAILLSPWLLFAMVGAAHNDIWILVLITLSILLLQQKNFFKSSLVLLVSVFFKYITLALVPFYILYWIKHTTKPQAETKQHIIMSGIILLGLFVFFEQFLGIVTGIFNQAGLSGYSLTYGLQLLFGKGGVPFLQQSIFPFLFLILYATILYRYWKSERTLYDLMKASALTIASIFIFVTQLWGYWYLAWILPFIMIFSKRTQEFLFIMGSVHLLVFFGLWYLSKLTELSIISIQQMLLSAPFLMIILTLSLCVFLVQLWKDSCTTGTIHSL
ncbi:hypothetical protein KC573_01575 [candidate division WWE3 bacterium]|uniref:DUF2029 domain-containing protein n=1 Tax=candidate division WWE3 bacterium TaxID=2053526 RepID=A0A955LVG9_UNCKA|nr:hypothetical protein [candidate division WWE3 bacterium]